jgi:hypothetical protein
MGLLVSGNCGGVFKFTYPLVGRNDNRWFLWVLDADIGQKVGGNKEMSLHQNRKEIVTCHVYVNDVLESTSRFSKVVYTRKKDKSRFVFEGRTRHNLDEKNHYTVHVKEVQATPAVDIKKQLEDTLKMLGAVKASDFFKGAK